MASAKQAATATAVIPIHAFPDVHARVKELLASEPRGRLLDIPAGSGAFSQWAAQNGFETYAGDLNDHLFQASGVLFKHTDLNQGIPFEDQFFDTVVCIEGIEHLENQFLLIREIARVLRPGGKLILTTPSLMNIDSRLHFFFTGFEDSLPLPLDHTKEQGLSGHINLVLFPALEFNLRRHGFKIEALTTNRYRRGSRLLYPFLYPLMYIATKRLLGKERDPDQRQRNRELFKLMLSREMLLGRIHIIKAVKSGTSDVLRPTSYV